MLHYLLKTTGLSLCLTLGLVVSSGLSAMAEQPTSAEKQAKGMQLVTKLLAGTSAGSVPLPAKFGKYTVEHLFGEVWQGTDMSLQERSYLTCVTLIALNREAEMRLHFVGAKNVGVPRARLEAAIAHQVHYAGWPVGMTALKVLHEVWPVEPKGTQK